MIKLKTVLSVVLALLTALLSACTGTPEQPPQTSVTAAAHTEAPPAEHQTHTPDIMEEYSMQTINAIEDTRLKFYGRSDMAKDYAGLNWSYSGLEFRGYFDGGITISYTHLGGYSAYIRVVIDNDESAMQKLELKQGSTSAKIADVKKGYHSIRLYKTSEAGHSIIRLHSLTFSGALDSRPENGALSIEFVGDSITCGAGILTNESAPPDEVYERSGDAYLSFAALTARALNADTRFVCLSGWGVVQGGDNPDAAIPNVYEYTNGLWNNQEKWDFEKNPSDVIVISLGTNDYQLADGRMQEFLDGVQSFIAEVRLLNPDSYIIWTYGMINKNFSAPLKQLIDEYDDNRLCYIEMPADSSAGWGHPGRTAHENCAKILAAKIKELTGTA